MERAAIALTTLLVAAPVMAQEPWKPYPGMWVMLGDDVPACADWDDYLLLDKFATQGDSAAFTKHGATACVTLLHGAKLYLEGEAFFHVSAWQVRVAGDTTSYWMPKGAKLTPAK